MLDTVYLKFLLSRVFLSAGLYTIVKNDLAWTNLADMSWSSMLDAPFPLPLIWHADKFPPVLHSVIGGLTIAVEIAASLILMASPPGGVFEFLANVSMTASMIWSACVGNLNWSILTLLALSVGTINEEIIAAVVGTDIFQRFGCKRVLAPLTEDRVEKAIVKAIVPSIVFTTVVHLPTVSLALKYGSFGPVVSRDSVPAGLWSVLATIPGVLAVVYGLLGGGKNERGLSIRVAATLVALAAAWLIGTTDVVGYDMEGTLSSSILPVPYVRSAMVPEERGNFGAPVPHTLDGRSALTFHVQAEGMPNPDHSMEGVWELNMPYSVNSDQRPRFLSFYHPRVDYVVWKLHTQEEVERLGSVKPFLVELLCTCLAMPEKCGRLAERVLLPKENEGDHRRRLVQDDLGRRALVAFSRKWEVTDDKYGLYWWSSAGSAAITGVPAGLMVNLPRGWCPQSAYRNPIFRVIAKVPITINEVSIGVITAGMIAKLLFGYPQHLVTAAQMPAKMTALETTTSDLKLQVYTLDALRACRKLWRLACELHTSSSCMRVGTEQLRPLELGGRLTDIEDRIGELEEQLRESRRSVELPSNDLVYNLKDAQLNHDDDIEVSILSDGHEDISGAEELPRGVFRSFEKNSAAPTSSGDGGLPAGISRVTSRATGLGQSWPGEGNRRVGEDDDLPRIPRELPKGMARVGRETPNVKLRRPPPPPPAEEPSSMRLPKGLVKVGEAEKRAERGLPRGVTPISSAKVGMDGLVDAELPQGLKRITDLENAAPVRREKLENISFEGRSEARFESANSAQHPQGPRGTIPVVQRPSMAGGVMITPVESSAPPASLSVPKSTREIATEVTPGAVEILKVYVSGKSEPGRIVVALKQLAGHHQNVEEIEGLENLPEYQRLLDDMGAALDLARFSGPEISELAEYFRILGAPGVANPSRQMAKRLSFQICERLHELSPVERIRTIYVITTWMGLRLDDYTHWALHQSIDSWIDSPEVDDAAVLPALYLLCESSMRKRSHKVLTKPKVFTRMEGMVDRLEVHQVVDMVKALGKQEAQKSIVSKALTRLAANPGRIPDRSLPALAGFLRSTDQAGPDMFPVAAHARKRLSDVLADQSVNRNDAAHLVVELAKMPTVADGVLDESAEMIRTSANHLDREVLPQLLLLYTAEGKPMRELEISAMAGLREIQPKGIAKLCLAAAAGGMREKNALVALYGECLDRARQFDPEDFIDAFYSMSLAGLVNDDALVEKVDIEKIIRQSPVSALPSLAWSLVVANFSRPLPWSVLCSRIIEDPARAVGDVECDDHGVCVKGDPHQAALLYEALASAAALKWFVIDEPSVVAGMEKWKVAWRSTQAQQDPPSRMPWEEILNKLDISHQMEVEVGYKWPLWEVPILMSELSCVIDPKLGKSQIVHYYSGLTTGTAKLRHRIWNAKGYAVFGIGDDQFPEASGGGASDVNCDFLAGLLDIVVKNQLNNQRMAGIELQTTERPNNSKRRQPTRPGKVVDFAVERAKKESRWLRRYYQNALIHEKVGPLVRTSFGVGVLMGVRPDGTAEVQLQTLKMYPRLTDVRIQIAEAGATRSPLVIARNIIANEGFLSLYKGLDAGIVRQLTYTTTRLGVFRLTSMSLQSPHEKTLPFWKKGVAGLFAGGVGAFVGTPADLSLVRLQADATLPPAERRNYKG
ncbi:hypothetical protein FOZ63_028305, partial [Perkinsus olseni]